MSSLHHEHQRFSPEFLKVITQKFNGVVGNNLLSINFNILEISVTRHAKDDKRIIVNLFTKLATAFKAIKQKYLPDKHRHIKLRMKEDDETLIIRIHGIWFIPPGKIINLLVLILWFFIRYKTGEKPNQTLFGKTLTEEWKHEEKELRQSINQSPRRLRTAYSTQPCHLCGAMTNSINQWEYRHGISKSITIQTRVCQRHRNMLV